ncbi:MAG: hypothetical protein F6K55_06705 [Moorea sp. SIO4A3]|nr:hypothetical protein [Moorena sp. SIO4A3]
MQRGLGEAARSWGFPRGKQRCVHVVSPKENRGVPHTAPPHERLPWFPP